MREEGLPNCGMSNYQLGLLLRFSQHDKNVLKTSSMPACCIWFVFCLAFEVLRRIDVVSDCVSDCGFCRRDRTQFYRDDRIASVARVVFAGRKRVVWNIFGTTETTHTTDTTTRKPRLQLSTSFAPSTRVTNIFMKSFYLVWYLLSSSHNYVLV